MKDAVKVEDYEEEQEEQEESIQLLLAGHFVQKFQKQKPLELHEYQHFLFHQILLLLLADAAILDCRTLTSLVLVLLLRPYELHPRSNQVKVNVKMEKWGLKFGKMVPKVKPADLLNSWKIVKADMVEVIAGAYKGKQGKVLRVQRDRNGLIVEGVNLVRFKDKLSH